MEIELEATASGTDFGSGGHLACLLLYEGYVWAVGFDESLSTEHTNF